MSFVKWLYAERNSQQKGSKTNIEVVLQFIFVAMFLGFIFIIINKYTDVSLGTLGLILVGLFVYCLAGYFIKPKPDTSDMGYAGGLIDNPFSFSDDVNRGLLTLKIILIPGVFFAITFIQMTQILLALKSKK
ncbi:MAG: hypothetical protein COA79_14170 [Planctomycetota bacterium]|nr:MAG: hypothetical protein COA79_14170 [Planctomycetota bacterium]